MIHNINLLTLIIATLSLIAAVLLPFIQKKYEERKARINFEFYIKQQFTNVYRLAEQDKVQYTTPTIADNFDKEFIPLIQLAKRIKSDLDLFGNSTQPRIMFHFLCNLQNFCNQLYYLRMIMERVDTKNLSDRVLENGEKLSTKHLKMVHGLLLLMEAAPTIILRHDQFHAIKSVERNFQNSHWSGIKIKSNILQKNEIWLHDMEFVRQNKESLYQLISISAGLRNEVCSYFDIARRSL